MADALIVPTLPADTASRLAEFARCCKAALRAVSLYPARHPAIGTSLARLVESAARVTGEGALRLDVRADTLLLSGVGMPKPDPAVRELAELLHRHLIGRITINGPDGTSWRTLLRLLARAPEEVRADGGIAHLWGTAGGPSVEILEIDYAEVLRDKRGTVTSLDDIIAAVLEGAPVEIDDEALDLLLAALADPRQLEDLIARLEAGGGQGGSSARAAAAMTLLQKVIARARERHLADIESALRPLARVAARLTADDMLRLLGQRDADGAESGVVTTILQAMDDGDLGGFVARSVIEERGGTARLAHAFQALIADTDRRRRVLAIAEEQVSASPFGEETTFEELWGQVESMVTSYSDAGYVSDAYARELWNAQSTAMDVERANDDPPERIAGWMTTINDTALRGLDHQLLEDLLRIEEDLRRWRDVAETTVAHAEALVRVAQFDAAWQLGDAVVREASGVPERRAHLPQLLERFGRGSITRNVAEYLRSADDEAFARFQRLCRAVGTPVIAPLAEALSAERDARSRRRLRDVLIGFGAQGRDVVQQLMQAPNWEVRRTAAVLLREFGGSDGLRELIPLLTDHEPLVQREALQALILNGTDEAAGIFVSSLAAMNGRTRERLVAEFVTIRDPRAASFFCYLVRNLDRAKHADVYVAAVEALGAFAETRAIEALKSALERGDWWAPARTRRIRQTAAAALRRIGNPAALETLKGAAASGSRGVRSAARAHLPESS